MPSAKKARKPRGLPENPEHQRYVEEVVKQDKKWTEDRWKSFLEDLVSKGIVKWTDVTPVVLGALNPPQVGTQRTKDEWQEYYGKGKVWQQAKKWLYSQSGKCAKPGCENRLTLESAHEPGHTVEDLGREGAARFEYIRLMCKRHNVGERKSHKKAGLTFQTAESALMWLLLNFRPKTYAEFKKLCRDYGLTMADIRFQEAWAMAVWLSRDGKYVIEEPSQTVT